MRISRTLVLIAGIYLAQSLASAPISAQNWKPGPANDPQSCRDLWEAIGLPTNLAEGDSTVVCHTRYVLSHNNGNKTPDWVIEHLTREQISGNNTRPKLVFKPEELVPPPARALDKDYVKSGFDRGHQAPSEDFNQNSDWMEESFILSNVVPQVGLGFNRGIWAQLESNVRRLATDRDELYIITGPIPQSAQSQPLTISATANACGNVIKLVTLSKASICDANNQNSQTPCDSGVAVPSALFKIIYDPQLNRANAYIMPNMDHREAAQGSKPVSYLNGFRTTVHVVEQYTGFQFLTALSARDRRQQVEMCVATMLH